MCFGQDRLYPRRLASHWQLICAHLIWLLSYWVELTAIFDYRTLVWCLFHLLCIIFTDSLSKHPSPSQYALVSSTLILSSGAIDYSPSLFSLSGSKSWFYMAMTWESSLIATLRGDMIITMVMQQWFVLFEQDAIGKWWPSSAFRIITFLKIYCYT